MVFVGLASRMGAVALWLVLLGKASEWQEGVVLCSRCCWGELANGKRGWCCAINGLGESWRMAGWSWCFVVGAVRGELANGKKGQVLCEWRCWGELANGIGWCCAMNGLGESWRMAGGAGVL